LTAVSERRLSVAGGVPGVHRRPRTWGEKPSLLPALIALAPAAVTAAVGLRGLGDREMWEDEYATWHASTLSLTQLGALLRHIDLVHAAYYLIIHVWVQLAGSSPFVLRLPSMFAMSICAACVALVGRRLATAPVGFVAGLIFAVVPSVSRYAEEARSYALVTMAAVVATLLLLRALEKDTRARLVLYGLSIAFIGLVHFVALTVLGAHAILVLRTTRTTEARRWRIVEAGGIGMLTVIPLLALASHQSSAIGWIKADAVRVKTFPEHVFLSAPVAIAIITLAVVGTIFLLASRRPGDRNLAAILVAWAVLPPIFCYLSFPVLHLFLPRYVLFVVPAWSILAAVAACRSGELVWRHLWPLTATVAILAVAWVGMPDQRAVRVSPVAGQPDFRAATTAIHDGLRPGDGIVYNDPFGGSADLARLAVSYEMRDEPRPRDVFLWQTGLERGWYAASECADPKPCRATAPRLWLIYTGESPDPFTGMAADRASLLELDYKVARTDNFTGVVLVLLTRSAGQHEAAGLVPLHGG
jgi:mannosyltransferase